LIRSAARAAFSWLDHHRFAWQRRLVAYIVVVLSFVACLVLIQHNYSDDLKRSCDDRAQGRDVLRGLVITAYTQAPPDYSKIPSFGELDAPTKRFLIDLGSASNRQAGRLDEVLAKVPEIHCP
jgi:hypothetical protein